MHDLFQQLHQVDQGEISYNNYLLLNLYLLFSSGVSVHRVYPTGASSNHTFPSHLPLKKIKPEPWQRFFDVCK